MTVAENWKLGHESRLVRSRRRHDATRLRCRQIVQTRRDSSRLSPTSCEFNTHRRRNSTGVGGVYWALAIAGFLVLTVLAVARYGNQRELLKVTDSNVC